MSLVSVIIPVYNRPEMIVEAVQSVLDQTYDDIEIIIVDDGSTDETPNVLASMSGLHSNITIFHQQNSGPGAARQKGLDASNGEFIQFLDSDDLLCPSKFELQVSALKSNDQADLAYGITRLEYYRGECISDKLKGTGEVVETMFPKFLEERWWSTSTPLHRKSILTKVGPWKHLSNEEDWEYDCRIASLGGKLIYVPQLVSITRRHSSNISSLGLSTSALKDRTVARLSMYQSALDSVIHMPRESFQHFSKSVFLLSRQCAENGLNDEAEKLLGLAIESNPDGENLFHFTFRLLAKMFGFKQAASIAKIWQRIRK